MSRRLRFGGGSLALRLSTIALVPMIALGALSLYSIENQDATDRASQELADDIALRRDVAAVITPATIERVALSGLAQVDALGVDRELVTGFTGLDLAAIQTDNNRVLDDALFDLRTANDEVRLGDGTLLHERIAAVVRELRLLRQENAALAGDPAQVDAMFDDLDTVLDLALDQIDQRGVDSVATVRDIEQLSDMDSVLTTAAQLTKTTSKVFITADGDGTALLDIATSTAIHRDRTVALASTLDPVESADFEAIASSLGELPADLFTGVDRSASSVAFEPEDVQKIAALLFDQVTYLGSLEEFSTKLHSETFTAATIRSADAAQAARTTKLVVGLIGISVLVITLFVMVTTARPLLRLSRRASDIGSGEIRGEPLPLRGPRVVRNLTQSMNDMSVTLSDVDAQIEAMSDGNIAGAAEIELPGAIGVSMRQSVARLSSMTEELAYQAQHDLLTGIPNRLATMERLGALLERNEDFALLFIDIDGFKGVNDTHGHSAGDDVLRSVAERLDDATRRGEFVARLGGDEFVIIVGDSVSAHDALRLGRRVINEIELPYEMGDEVFALSASVGVVHSEPGMTALDALHQADSALYLAKQRGRGRVERFDAALQTAIEHEADLALALRHGVRNDELELHLQPILNVTSGRMDHAEALVRWNRPGVGLVPPGEFIPIAERSSLIFEVEQWVLRETCRILAEQRAVDPDFDVTIAVNISGRHLIEGELLDDLESSLRTTGADPTLLEFELTETRLLEDLELATTILNTIRARGISIAVDDFGTGYSSMNYLRDLPIDTIKIDRSFVSRSTEHGYDSTVIEAVITIADTLQLGVVAEGIETQEQLDYVTGAGCHRAQGFLLARPMPAVDAMPMLTSDVVVR